MNPKTFLTMLAFTLCFTSWSQTPTCLENLDHPDLRFISQVVNQDTIHREYVLKISANYDETQPTPLILNLHGFGDCCSGYSKSMGEYFNFEALANAENIIVAYPQGAYRPEKEDTYWEPGDNGVDNIYENDVYFIEELIYAIASEYNINMNKVYACGYSNGGMMSYSLACNRSNLFSAIGIMSGTMLEEECNLERPVPVITFHGIEDEVLPYQGSLWYQSVAEVVEFWLDQNNIPANSLVSTSLNDGKVILDEYASADNACLSLYTINEEHDKPGEHTWFSDEIEELTPNEILWNFFNDNCGAISSVIDPLNNEISIYPNPVGQILEVKNAGYGAFSLYDINGKLVLEGVLDSDVAAVELGSLQSGLYIFRVGHFAEKLLKF